MEDNIGKFFLLNGDLIEAENAGPDSGEGPIRAIYEVIRVIDGVPLFLEDHYIRLCDSMRAADSVSAAGGNMPVSGEELKLSIRRLVTAHGLSNCNVKLMIYKEAKRDNRMVLLYLSKYHYPAPEEISEGVKTGLIHLERANPNVKQLNFSYKEAVSARIREGGFFEVLLVNHDGFITEGSKSNAFFVKGGRIITAPGEHVLRGITRRYVLDACRNAGVEVVEDWVAAEELDQVEGLFLSGTSIKVLPIRTVDRLEFRSSIHPVVRAVSKEYNKILEEYIHHNLSNPG